MNNVIRITPAKSYAEIADAILNVIGTQMDLLTFFHDVVNLDFPAVWDIDVNTHVVTLAHSSSPITWLVFTAK